MSDEQAEGAAREALDAQLGGGRGALERPPQHAAEDTETVHLRLERDQARQLIASLAREHAVVAKDLVELADTFVEYVWLDDLLPQPPQNG